MGHEPYLGLRHLHGRQSWVVSCTLGLLMCPVCTQCRHLLSPLGVDYAFAVYCADGVSRQALIHVHWAGCMLCPVLRIRDVAVCFVSVCNLLGW